MLQNLQRAQFGIGGGRSQLQDATFDQVVFYAPMTTNFADVSNYNRAPTASGPVVNNTELLFGENSAQFGGVVTYPDAASLDIGTQFATLEGFLFIAALPGGVACFASHSQGTNFNWNSHQFMLYVRNTGQLGVTFGISTGEFKIESGSSVPTGTWFHWAVCRGGNALSMYMEGSRTANATFSDATSITTSNTQLRLGGAGPDSGSYGNLTCRQREFRYTIGANGRRYSGASYAVPTAPFPKF